MHSGVETAESWESKSWAGSGVVCLGAGQVTSDTLAGMVEAEGEDVQTVTWIFANGEALEFEVRGWPARGAGVVVRNGGLAEAALIIAAYVAAGVIGNGAYDALKLGLRLLRLRLAWGSDDEKSRYVSYIAQLAVAARLAEPTEVKVISCRRQRDYWEAVLLAGARTFRVQIPPNDPRPTAISVDVE